MGLLDKFARNAAENGMYTNRWLRKASGEELETEREKVRMKHCSGDPDATLVLDRFDQESRKRYEEKHKGEEIGFPAQREHGWYLPNDD